MSKPIITRIEIDEFEYEIMDMTPQSCYQPGTVATMRATGLKIHTDIGGKW